MSKRSFVISRNLKTEKIDGKKELLSVDQHKDYIQQKLKKVADEYRPDIVHRSILAVFDSPLSKAEMTETYIHTTDNKVIRVDPTMRVDFAN